MDPLPEPSTGEDGIIWRLALGLVAGLLVVPAADPLAASALIAALALAALVRPLAAPFLLGAALGLLSVITLAEGPVLTGPIAIQGAVMGAPTTSQADVALTRWARPGGVWQPASGRLRVGFGGVPPAPGTDVVAFGVAGPLVAKGVPGEPDPVWNARRARVRTRLAARTWAAVGVPARAPDAFDGLVHGGVLRALATGDRRDVDPATEAMLQKTGTSHVLSVSGFHIGLLAWVIGGSLTVALRAIALVYPRGAPTWLGGVAGAVAGVAFAWAAGAPSSAQRAAFGVVYAASGRALGRPIRPYAVLGASMIVVLAIDPAALGAAGFQLSFGAMLGLFRVTPWLLKWVPPDRSWVENYLWGALATTVGATVGTLPASALWFQALSPTAPLANVVALPAISVAVMPFAAAGALLPAPLAGIAAWVADRAFAGLCAGLTPLAVAPWTIAAGPLGALAIAALIAWPHRVTWLLAGAVVVLGAAEPLRSPRITFLDVAQGDATLVEQPDGTAWLVDGGPAEAATARWLRRQGRRSLDGVIASHGDADHVAGLLPVVEGLRVGHLWLPSADGTVPLLIAARRQGADVRIRPPIGLVLAGENRNDRGLVVAVGGVLFPGDASDAVEAQIAARTWPAEVLKVGHHGAASSTSDALLAAIDPVLAVISVGAGNFYGHPHDEALERLACRGIPVLRTDQLGTIELTNAPDALWERHYRMGEGWSVPRAYPHRGEGTILRRIGAEAACGARRAIL